MADQVNKKNLDGILKSVSGKLGTNQDNLKNVLDGGNLDEITKNLRPGDAKKLQQVLSDKEQAKKMLSTPQAQQLLKKLFEGK